MIKHKAIERIKELFKTSSNIFISYYKPSSKAIAICNNKTIAKQIYYTDKYILVGLDHKIPYEKIIKIY